MIFRTYIHINRLIHISTYSLFWFSFVRIQYFYIKTVKLITWYSKFVFMCSKLRILKFILYGKMYLCNKAKKYMLICRLIHQATNMENTLNKFHHLILFLYLNLSIELKSWYRKFATNYDMISGFHGINMSIIAIRCLIQNYFWWFDEEFHNIDMKKLIIQF